MRVSKNGMLLTVALLFQLCAAAQLPDYYVHVLGGQQGFRTAEILNIARDRQGILWMTTQTAVYWCDGRQARVFPINETALQIFIDEKDRKWLLTRAGVFLFQNDHEGFKPVHINARGPSVPVCLFGAAGKLVLVTQLGLSVYDNNTGSFGPSPGLELHTARKISGVFSFRGNNLFLSTGDTLHGIDMAAKRFYKIPFRSISSMVALADNRILVTDWRSRTWHINFNTGKSREITPSEALHSDVSPFLRVNAGEEIRPGIFLIASSAGLIEYDLKQDRFRNPVFYHKGVKLENNQSVRYIYKADDGKIYMPHADGLVHFDPSACGIRYVRNYAANGVVLSDIDIRSFAEDEDGKIWLAMANGMARMDMRNGALQNFITDDRNNPFTSVRHLLFRNGRLYIGTGGKGLWIYDTRKKLYLRPQLAPGEDRLLSETYVWRMLFANDEKLLVIGGNFCFEMDLKSFVAKKITLQTPRVARSAMIDSAGRLWVGGTAGLICMDALYRPLFSVKDSFPDKRIASMVEIQRDRVLVGTKGLYEIRAGDNNILSLRKIPGLLDNRFIYCMEKDAAGMVWLGTDDGLYRYDPRSGETDIFDASDNIQSYAFNSNGLYYAPSGMLYAGGKTGFNYFDPVVAQKREVQLQTGISSFSIGNDDSSYFIARRPFRVPWWNRSISCVISAPEYTNPHALQYRYRLIENDKWFYNGNNNIVTLHDLPPGQYKLQVSSSQDGARWFDSSGMVSFSVMNPWWWQWWFILLCCAAAGIVLGYLYRYRQRVKIARQHRQAIAYFANSGYEHAGTEDILWDITRNCVARLGLEDCVLYLVDEQRQVLVQKAAYGPKNPDSFEIANPIEIPIGKGIVGHVARSGKAEIVNDTRKDSRYIVDDKARLSEITVPVLHQGKVIGIIDSESSRRHFFNRKHLYTLQHIASICAAKISRSLVAGEMRRAELQLNELNTRMLETKFLNLRLQMNPHFLFNSLSSIQHLVVSQQTNEAYTYLSVFSGFLRSILQYADRTVITLEEELDILRMYVRLEALGFDNTFSYTIQVDDKLETEDVWIPPLMIQPLIENAIWHGLVHKEGNKHFSVRFINDRDEQLICIVEDNGVGREAAASIARNSFSSQTHQSKGTALIRERLQILQKKTGKNACMIIEDGDQNGTIVKLIIPFYNNNEI